MRRKPMQTYGAFGVEQMNKRRQMVDLNRTFHLQQMQRMQQLTNIMMLHQQMEMTRQMAEDAARMADIHNK